jgi:hypothetical protein
MATTHLGPKRAIFAAARDLDYDLIVTGARR